MDSKSSDFSKSCENEASAVYLANFKEIVNFVEDRINKVKSVVAEVKGQKKRSREDCAKDIENIRNLITPGTSGTKVDSSESLPHSTAESTLSDQSLLTYEEKLAKCRESLLGTQTKQELKFENRVGIEPYQRRLMNLKTLCTEELTKAIQRARDLQPRQAVASELKLDDEIIWDNKQVSTNIKDTAIAAPDNKENSKIKGQFCYDGLTKYLLGSSAAEEKMKRCAEKEQDVSDEIKHALTLRSEFDTEPYQRQVLKLIKLCSEELSKVKDRAHGSQSPQAVAYELKLDDKITGGAKQESTKIKDIAVASPDDKANSEIKGEFAYDGSTSLLGSSAPEEEMKKCTEKKPGEFLWQEEKEEDDMLLKMLFGVDN